MTTSRTRKSTDQGESPAAKLKAEAGVPDAGDTQVDQDKAAAETDTSGDGEGQPDQSGADVSAPLTALAGNYGPGTGVDAPAEATARYPSTIVDPSAAPLSAPADAYTQTTPEPGYNLSSTDPVYAATGGRSVAGEDFVGLVDADDNPVGVEDLFDDPDAAKTFVTAKDRVYETFYYPNTRTPAKRLVFVPGQRIPRAQAETIKQQVQSAPEPGEHASSATRDSTHERA